MAEEHGLRTIAFPAISTGAYGFPADRAAHRRREVRRFRPRTTASRWYLVAFGEQARLAYERALAEASGR